MIRFPGEGHWILKPADQQFWFASILDWFDQWLKRDGQPAETPPETQER
jgi:dipeptidyl aminopeptidase/acylaminoacyl peptidase